MIIDVSKAHSFPISFHLSLWLTNAIISRPAIAIMKVITVDSCSIIYSLSTFRLPMATTHNFTSALPRLVHKYTG